MDRLSLEARKKLIELLLRQDKEIRGIFIRAADRIAEEIREKQEDGRSWEYLESIEIHLRNIASMIEEELSRKIKEGLTISVEAGMHKSKQTTLSLLKKANIDWKPIERSYFRVNISAVEAMWERSVKGLNLSDRIWEKSQKASDALSSIIREGIAMGEHPVKIAEMLQGYVRDGTNTFAVEYPNMMKRMNIPENLSYESLRLARTEMAAAYGQGTIRAAQVSPSAVGIRWSLSNAGVTCELCKANSEHDEGLGKGVYRIENLPTYPAHPNCLCVLSQENEDTDEFVDRLIEWNRNPSFQPDIEQWYQMQMIRH